MASLWLFACVTAYSRLEDDVVTLCVAAAWPLLTYDTLALKVATDTFLEWWPKFAEIQPFGQSASAAFHCMIRA